MEDDKVEQHEQLDFFNFNLTVLAQAWEEDIYLRLSAYGMMVFCVLCALIVVCWFRYEATISDMIDTKSGWSFAHHY